MHRMKCIVADFLSHSLSVNLFLSTFLLAPTSSLKLYLIFPLTSSPSAGGAPVPKPQIGSEEQPPLHPGPAARHLPAPAHHLVSLWGQNGDFGGKWVLPGLHGEPNQEDQADHQLVQGGQGTYVRGELATQVSWLDKYDFRGKSCEHGSIPEPLCWCTLKQGTFEVWSPRDNCCITSQIHSLWITATAQAQSEQLHPSPAPRVGCSSSDIKTRAERCCGLCMWASVVRMALNLQLPACLSLCFCASLSLPSSWTFSLLVAVSLQCFLCWSHTVPLSLISFFSLTFSNLPLFLLKQMHKCTSVSYQISTAVLFLCVEGVVEVILLGYSSCCSFETYKMQVSFKTQDPLKT